LQGTDADADADFSAGFSGSHRYSMDYLLEEVLARQPTDVRILLRSTAMLERLCGSLCDALPRGMDTVLNIALPQSAR
ncbi:MAG: hypothetical protein ACK47M_15910, partial [Caldilinea sp.]